MNKKEKAEMLKNIAEIPLFIKEARVKFYNESGRPPKKRKSTVYQTIDYNNRRFFKPIELK